MEQRKSPLADVKKKITLADLHRLKPHLVEMATESLRVCTHFYCVIKGERVAVVK